MPATNQPEHTPPPRPAEGVTLVEFGAALKALREWSGLTQLSFQGTHRAMSDSSISRAENGAALPGYEWVNAYVVHCLRNRQPSMTRPQLDAALAPWQAAWTRLNHTTTEPGPAVPEPRATTTETPPTPVDDSESPDLPAAPDEPERPRRVRLPRGRVLVGGAVLVVVVAAIITAAATGMFDTPDTPTTPAPLSSSAVAVSPVHASGQIENLRGVEGIDLDTNTRADQEAPGVDISPAATATHLNAMANRVTFTVLPEPGPETRERCVKAVDWMRQIPGIYDLTEGRNICVITDEGRFSMLTLTKRSSAASPVMNFHYTTWP